MEFLSDLFSDPLFMPHGHCYLWQPELLWLQVISNGLIGAAYVAIATTLAYLSWKGRYVPFKGMAIAFGVFIVTCGLTHFMDVYVVWEPAYWLDGGLRAVTALAAVGTAIMLPPLVPKALALARGARAAHARGIELESAMDDLEQMHEKTRQLEKAKTQFFANVSHELRTPLALILGPIEKLTSAENLTAAQRHDCRVVTSNAQMLLKHVDDLLDISKLEAGKLAPDYVRLDVAPWLRRVAGHFEVLAAEHKTEFAIDTPEHLECEIDPERLERVVVNLLSNAFKYSPPGMRVSCRLSLTEDDKLLIEVADSGPGVKPEHRERIFERFAQIDDASSRTFGGTGLGLAIARELLEVMGGSIEVREGEGGGALFRVELPRLAPEGQVVGERDSSEDNSSEGDGKERAAAAPELATPGTATDPEPEGTGRPVVLVVDDNPVMNRFVCETLGTSYRCESALDGEAGLARALELEPDLIVSDIMMPRMSGDEMVKEVRGQKRLDNTPIILLTAKADDALRVKLLAEGAQDYVMKPFSAAELQARVANLVSMKRARDVLLRDVASQAGDLEDLASEVTQRKRELAIALDSMQVAKEHAERASELKSSFLSMVSHELRSPLAALSVQIERLRVEGAVPVEAQQQLDRMTGTTLRLEELVEGLLSYTRIQSGRIEPHVAEIDVGAISREVVEDIRPRGEHKGLSVELVASEEALEPLQSDPRLLRLVLLNLLGNAVKFTSRGAVTMGVERAGRDRRFVVTDTGAGIAPKDQARIFEPFEQSEPTRYKHTAGVGLGLALVRELVAGLQGTIQVESVVGRGTTFTVTVHDLVSGAKPR